MAPLDGPVGVGAFVDAIMLGCLVVQSCLYYENSRGDTWLLKILLTKVYKVLLILLLLFSHLGCTIAWLWASTEANAGDTPMPDYAHILFGVSSVFGAVISFFGRCFFSYRILKASNSRMLAFVSFVFCIFSFTAALGAACAFFSNTTTYLTNQMTSSWIFPFVFISGLICDLAINIVTGYCLRYQTSIGVANALGRIACFLLLIVETGAVTGLFSIAAVVVFWWTRPSLAWVGLLVSMPGVFANTLLAALNVQGHLHADVGHQRALVFKIGDQLIDTSMRAKRPPVMIAISKRVEQQYEKSPV